jgi:hypothetical protein
MAEMQEELQYYNRRAYTKCSLDPPRHDMFKTTKTSAPPLLRNDRVNRIMVYFGSFNPPHVGYFAVLEQGFRNAGPDLNIIAAIIPHDYRHHKKDPNAKKLYLPKAERAALWKKHNARSNHYYWA